MEIRSLENLTKTREQGILSYYKVSSTYPAKYKWEKLEDKIKKKLDTHNTVVTCSNLMRDQFLTI